jgi:hypothetical protein
MTSKDTTGDKLVASIRKTKTGSTPAVGSTVKKKVTKKAAPKVAKKAVAQKTTAKSSSANTNSNRKKELVNMFHSGRRVWPD